MNFQEFKSRYLRREIVLSVLAFAILSGVLLSQSYALKTNLFGASGETPNTTTEETQPALNPDEAALNEQIEYYKNIYDRHPSETALWKLIQLTNEKENKSEMLYYARLYESNFRQGRHFSTVHRLIYQAETNR